MRQTNSNSIISYHELGDRELSQLERIFQFIKKFQPVNSRQISLTTGIERSAVVARINKLKEQERIEVAFTERCKITNKMTDFYQVVKPKPVSKPGEQTNLF